MTETKRPDHVAKARETVGDPEEKRGLVVAEMEACGSELARLRGEIPGEEHAARHRRGSLALAAILGDEDAARELEDPKRMERRTALEGDAAASRGVAREARRRLSAADGTEDAARQAAREQMRSAF